MLTARAGVLLQALAAFMLATGLQRAAAKPAAAPAAPPAGVPATAAPRTPTSLGPPLRGTQRSVLPPASAGPEPSPAAAIAPSSAGRPGRPITTPEQLRRVLVRAPRAACRSGRGMER